jgi:PQQ-dependent catabolism-associated CXXCW motif protein
MRRSVLALGALLIAGLTGVPPAGAQAPAELAREPRVALVLGNAKYEVGPLRNPANDADDMAKALKELGFRVTLHQDASHRRMIEAINAFGQSLKKGGVGLFYFAGHGVQSRGRNYLIPVNARIEKETQLEFDAVDVGRVLAAMDDAGNRVNLVVLDACRDNPFARSFRSAARGLAQIEAAQGTYIAFATAPGAVALDGEGRNGLYTRHLLESLKRSDTDIDKVFRRVTAEVSRATSGKQVPWVSSSLTGDFSFRVERAERAVAAAPPAPAVDPAAHDRVFWDQVKDSKNPDELNAYLEKYPDGLFAPLAKARVKALTPAPSTQGASAPAAARPSAPPARATGAPPPSPPAAAAPAIPSPSIAALPFVGDGAKSRIEREYVEDRAHKALALTEAGGWGSRAGRASVEEARLGALENCQKRNARHPCFLASVNGESVLASSYTPAAITEAAIEMVKRATLDAEFYYNEDRDDGIVATVTRRIEKMHAPTPRRHFKAKTISTRELVELYKRGRPVPINVLEWSENAFALPGTTWIQGMGKASLSKAQMAELGTLLAQVAPDKDAPLVLYCVGWDCWLSYNAALSAMDLGYKNVYWYRGGTNAWGQARLPVVRTKLTKQF